MRQIKMQFAMFLGDPVSIDLPFYWNLMMGIWKNITYFLINYLGWVINIPWMTGNIVINITRKIVYLLHQGFTYSALTNHKCCLETVYLMVTRWLFMRASSGKLVYCHRFCSGSSCPYSVYVLQYTYPGVWF